MTTLSLVRAQGLHAGYGEEEILHGLDFELPASGISALVGPGGSGKTTLLRLLSGQKVPGLWSRGRLEMDLRAPLLVPQPVIPRPVANPAAERSALEKRPSHIGRCAELFKTLDLEASFFLLDEPVDVLDEVCQESFATALRRRRSDRPIVLATHNLSFLRRAADYVVFLVDGSIIEAGPVADFFDRPRHERTRSFLRTGS